MTDELQKNVKVIAGEECVSVTELNSTQLNTNTEEISSKELM